MYLPGRGRIVRGMKPSVDTRFETPFGAFELRRQPLLPKERLRAWDAADAYLLEELAREPEWPRSPLLVNDAFGALGTALHGLEPRSWSDSFLARQALRDNLWRNGLDTASVAFIDSLQTPPAAERVLIKLPKSLALLEDQLLRLKPRLAEGAEVWLAGMQKAMPRSLWPLLERTVGPCDTLPGRRKAKLIRARVDSRLPLPENPWPGRYRFDEADIELLNHSALFSRERLDIGTRFLLEHLPQTEGEGDIVDLGCGNGVIGLMAARQNPEARVSFVDESWMAVASARENLRQVDADLRRCRFVVGNVLDDFETASADLILCNPPFHQQQAVGEGIARLMFRESARVLRPGGELWLVANRHLDYRRPLRRRYATVEQVAQNRKFVLLRAITGQ